ncbi:MAG: DNA polymerase IV [Gaiellaceae bacterium]|jgi:DNA polymerase-4
MLIAHLDLDAFYAACEVLEHPEYADRPLVVGGDPHGRGVVATASYEARPFGIYSAMSSAEALRRCPDAIFVRPDFACYRRRSRSVWEWIRKRMSCVEQVGIDEGYLELVTPYIEPARAILADLQQGLLRETRLSASIGCGGSKTVAKIASDIRKPGGLTVAAPEESAAFLAPLGLRTLPGIGPRLETRLGELGVRTIGELAALSDEAIARAIPGTVGRELQARARGIDERRVDPRQQPPVSQGAEETFPRDLVSEEEMKERIDRLAEVVWARLAANDLCARTATAKVRYHDFQTVTRSQTVREPFCSVEDLAGLARSLLQRALAERLAAVRLLGVYASTLCQRAEEAQIRLPL